MFLGGCTTLAGASAEAVGCRSGEIAIGDETPVGNLQTWTAVCRGQAYLCGRTLETGRYVQAPDGQWARNQRRVGCMALGAPARDPAQRARTLAEARRLLTLPAP